ncbi:4112_t:CDS:2 [Funneliformis geosporum]|uniref:4112_t:CDS:1 n=1 Tax=Funneliformis geosporum TaxID=1117311 RepID=A0A9W4ST08_9GLOM|nr:4112_t:CDS:2 [Funneliformis geosporum]
MSERVTMSVLKVSCVTDQLMSHQSVRQLISNIDQDPYEKALPVDIDTNKNIGALKKVIKNDISESVSARDLKLFKVDIPLGETRDENVVKMLELGDLNIGQEMNNNIQKISDYFSAQPVDINLHILVQLPTVATGKRSISPSVESRESKKGKTIEAEFSNICDLVKHLRNSKKEVIASTSGSTSIEDAIEEIIIKEEEVNPCNIIKHPQEKPLAVIKKPAIYVRESYEELYHLMIDQASKSSDHKFLVTGTSGIGKSCFLIYFLIQLLCESENPTIIFQPVQSEDFYCFEDLYLSFGRYDDFSAHFQSSETWYLADGILSPKLVPAKTVVALSPKGVVKDEFQEFGKDLVQTFYMSPWSLEELSFCRKYVFSDVPEDIMLALYDKAGGVPRYVFRRVEISLKYNLDPKTPEGKEMIIKKAFERVEFALLQVKNFDDLIACFTENAYFIQYSSRLVHRWPDPSYNDYHLQWASRYIYDEIERRLEKQSWSSLLERIQMMRNYPSARGIMFEMYVIHLFRSSNDQYAMRELRESPKTTDIPQHRKFSMGKSPTVGNIRTAKELSSKSDDIIILPETSNFGAVDLFYTPDMMFQVTVSNNHPIKQVELVNIVENMPAYGRKTPINLVFVVPDDIYDTYKYQDIVTKDAKSKSFRKVKTQDAKLKNVQQWVLKIDISMSKSTKFVKAKETFMQRLKFGSSSGSSSVVESDSPSLIPESGSGVDSPTIAPEKHKKKSKKFKDKEPVSL